MRGPVRVGHLARVMGHITGNDGLLTLRADAYTHMARGMSRRRFKPALVSQMVVHFDQFR